MYSRGSDEIRSGKCTCLVISGSAVAFAELGDDDDVVKDRIGRHPIFFQRHDEIIEVLDGHHVETLPAKCFAKRFRTALYLRKVLGFLRVSIWSR